MKSKFLKILSALLVVALLLALIVACAGCNKDKKRRAQEAKDRASAVSQIEDTVLNAIDDDWALNMTDEEIAKLAAPGDYAVAKGWTKLFGDVLQASSLQTAKLGNLSSAMRSQQGEALLEDVGKNAEFLLPLLREVGFTKEDVSELFYDLSSALVKDSGTVLNDTLEELNRLANLSGITLEAYSNIMVCLGDVNAAKYDLVPSDSEKERIIEAFESARAPIDAAIGFAYEMFFNSISDDMWKDLFASDGALENITDREIELVMDSLISNLDSLGQALTPANVELINNALDLLIVNFDEEELTSVLFEQIIIYAKFANMLVGATPMLLELLSSAGRVFGTPEVIAELRQNASGWDSENGSMLNNASVLTARLVKDFMNSYDAASLKGVIDSLFRQSGGGVAANFDIDKSALLLAVDVLINIADVLLNGQYEEMFGVRHPDVITSETLEDMLGFAFFMAPNISTLKDTYRKYRRGEARVSDFNSAVRSCRFDLVGVVFEDNISDDNIKDAYEFYIVEGVLAVEKKMAELTETAKRDIQLYVDDFYNADNDRVEALDRLAERKLVNGALSDAQQQELKKELSASGLFGIVSAILQIVNS